MRTARRALLIRFRDGGEHLSDNAIELGAVFIREPAHALFVSFQYRALCNRDIPIELEPNAAGARFLLRRLNQLIEQQRDFLGISRNAAAFLVCRSRPCVPR